MMSSMFVGKEGYRSCEIAPVMTYVSETPATYPSLTRCPFRKTHTIAWAAHCVTTTGPSNQFAQPKSELGQSPPRPVPLGGTTFGRWRDPRSTVRRGDHVNVVPIMMALQSNPISRSPEARLHAHRRHVLSSRRGNNVTRTSGHNTTFLPSPCSLRRVLPTSSPRPECEIFTPSTKDPLPPPVSSTLIEV